MSCFVTIGLPWALIEGCCSRTTGSEEFAGLSSIRTSAWSMSDSRTLHLGKGTSRFSIVCDAWRFSLDTILPAVVIQRFSNDSRFSCKAIGMIACTIVPSNYRVTHDIIWKHVVTYDFFLWFELNTIVIPTSPRFVLSHISVHDAPAQYSTIVQPSIKLMQTL